MKKLLFAVGTLALFSFILHDKNKTTGSASAPFTPGKKITVYTTAENTGLRLTLTDTVHFSNSGQPKETEPTIL